MKRIAWGQYSARQLAHSPPANSIAAVEQALEHGFDGIELDVQFSKDDEVVLLHDFKVDRETNGSGVVRDMTLSELQQLSKGEWAGEPVFVESLRGALRAMGDSALFMCDLRIPLGVPRAASIRAQMIRAALDAEGFALERMIVLAYTREHGLLLKESFPSAVVLLKMPQPPHAVMHEWVVDGAGLDGILIQCAEKPKLAEEFAEVTHAAGLKLGVYLHRPDLKYPMTSLSADYVTSVNYRLTG